jgi:hypothetical protein
MLWTQLGEEVDWKRKIEGTVSLRSGGIFAVTIAAGLMVSAWAGAAAADNAQDAPQAAGNPDAGKGPTQVLFDSLSAHYSNAIEAFNRGIEGFREANAQQSSLACPWLETAINSFKDAQDDMGRMIGIVEDAHQDASGFHATFDENAIELKKREDSFAQGCSQGGQ